MAFCMYRCEKCKTVVPAGQSANLVVVKTRPRNYRVTRAVRSGPRARPTYQEVDAGSGWETVQELSVCAACKQVLEDDESIPVMVRPEGDAS